MLRHFTAKFLRGLVAILPLVLSIYVLFWIFNLAEHSTRWFLVLLLPHEAYVPGLGVLVAIGAIYAVGLLVDKPIAREVLEWVEEPFTILPVVRSVYRAIKDFTSYVNPTGPKATNRVVAVRLPGFEFEMVGLVTREDLTHLPGQQGNEDRIAVYLPMSYQFGGYTVFVPKANVRRIPMDTEQAMRSVLMAWVSSGEGKNAGLKNN